MVQKAILLVEDDFLNRRLAKKILLENGYVVFEAKNTREALEILKKESIHLAILDINLGENEQDGISLGQHIHERFNLPFIYLTAYDNATIISKAIATTPFSYLTKPFKNVDLATSVAIAIKQSAHLEQHKAKIQVKDGAYQVALAIVEINYIESTGNYLLIHTDKKTYKLRSTIKQILETLPPSIFAQVHRAYVVNRTKVEKADSKSVVINDAPIPVSSQYKFHP